MDDASSLGGAMDALIGVGSVGLDGGTTSPISLDQMVWIGSYLENFPAERP